jgi:hypothetical protein
MMASNVSLPAPIRAAVNMAKRTLNRYYDRTDYSEVYRVAMGEYRILCINVIYSKEDLVLHPSFKLNYFRRVGWEPDWIESAWDIVRLEYEHTYKGQCDESTSGLVIEPDPMMPVSIHECVHHSIN